MNEWVAFDIETAQAPPRAHDGNYAIGITCAVIYCNRGPIHYHGVVQPDGRYSLRLTASAVREFARELVGLSRGRRLASINGAGFDFRVLAAECQDRKLETELMRLALAHYDPCFQMLCQRGFRVGLNALARGFGLGGKMEGMDGSKAGSDWFGMREDQERVLKYCEQDARLTMNVALNIESHNTMRWISRKGKELQEPVERFSTVQECLSIPLPDTSWMNDPPTRESVINWIKENEL